MENLDQTHENDSESKESSPDSNEFIQSSKDVKDSEDKIANKKSLSCSECRRAKRKCDKKKPKCSLCLKKGKKCSWSVIDKRKPASQNYTNSLLSRINALESALNYYSSQRASMKYKYVDGNYHLSLKDYNFREKSLIVKTHLPTPKVATESMVDVYDSKKLLNHLNSTFKSAWCLNLDKNGSISFVGPTSCRYIRMEDTKLLQAPKRIYSLESFDQFHRDVFSFFFKIMNKSLPLIDEELFLGSVYAAIEGDKMGKYASRSLVNSMMALYFLLNKSVSEYKRYKDLSANQLKESTESSSNIPTLQTLVVLSMLCMIEGDESQSSEMIARAVSLSYHLGLYIDNTPLVLENKITKDEGSLRDSVFWSIFVVDKLRSSVLGMQPYMNCTAISTKLMFCNILDYKKPFIDTFRETVVFSDLQAKMVDKCFSFELYAAECPPDKEEENLVEQKVIISEATAALSLWKKNMTSMSRYSNNKSIAALLLEILQLTYNMVINKPLIHGCLKLDIIDQFPNSPINVCSSAAEKIIKLCQTQDLSQSFFLYLFLYSLYFSSIICLYNLGASELEIRNKFRNLLQDALKMYEEYRSVAPVSTIYLNNLEKFKKEWYG